MPSSLRDKGRPRKSTEQKERAADRGRKINSPRNSRTIRRRPNSPAQPDCSSGSHHPVRRAPSRESLIPVRSGRPFQRTDVGLDILRIASVTRFDRAVMGLEPLAFPVSLSIGRARNRHRWPLRRRRPGGRQVDPDTSGIEVGSDDGHEVKWRRRYAVERVSCHDSSAPPWPFLGRHGSASPQPLRPLFARHPRRSQSRSCDME